MNVHHKPEKSDEKSKKSTQPPQTQARQPGIESQMRPRPEYLPKYPGVGKLKDKVAVITGAGGGIGRAMARLFANEGANVMCLDIGAENAGETVRLIRADGGELYLVSVQERSVALHLSGRFSGCPGNTLARRRVIEPILTSRFPELRIEITSGPLIPDGAEGV